MLTLVMAAFLTAAWAPEPVDRAAAERASAYEQLYKETGNGAVLWLAAEAHAQARQDAQAIAMLRAFTERKLGFEVTPQSPLTRLAGNPDYDALVRKLASDARKAGTTRQYAVIAAEGLVAEGIASDPQSGRIFVGDMAGNRIFVVERGAQPRLFARTGSLRPLGMKVDGASGLLRVAATTAFVPSEKPETALLSLDLASGEIKARAGAPDMRSINDLAIGPDGDIYATDSLGGAVFRLRPDASRFERVTEAGKMAYPNGIALTPDGKSIYVAQGVALRRIDTATKEVSTVVHPPSLALLSLDGLYWHEGSLIAVQNGAGRGRVLRLDLSDDGRTIANFAVVEGSHPEFDIPTTGTIVGDRFVFIANSQVDRLEDDGTISGPLTPVRLFETVVPKRPQ